MGSVFLAEHTHLRRPTAIKLLHRSLAEDPTSEERFRREATMAASIDHSAVAHIYDFDVSEAGEFFLAMEFVEGETLARRLKRDGRFPLVLAVKVLVDVGRGIDCAHKLGILHRDIKPDNVMLTSSGAVKLLDFGIARPVHPTSPVTSSGVAVGTPAYMSPEQLVADTLTPATDIYSLGLVAWELIAGHVPDAGRNVTELQASRFTKELPLLHRAREDCPESLSAVIHRALKVEPEARWPSAAAFADAAEAALRQKAAGRADLTTSGVHTRRLDRLEPFFARLRLAGRDREVRLVAEAVSAARSGSTAVLTIQADEGAGKSEFRGAGAARRRRASVWTMVRHLPPWSRPVRGSCSVALAFSPGGRRQPPDDPRSRRSIRRMPRAPAFLGEGRPGVRRNRRCRHLRSGVAVAVRVPGGRAVGRAGAAGRNVRSWS
jgi:serine/threonine protein kinase